MTEGPLRPPRWAVQPWQAPAELEVHEGDFESPDGRRLRLVAASRGSLISMAEQADALFGQLRPVEPGEEPSDDGFDEAVQAATARLLEDLGGHDALDVMTMLRRYMIPPDLSLWSESGSTIYDSWATAEVVALALLGLGLPQRDPACEVPTVSIVPQLVEDAAVIVQLAFLGGLVRLGWESQDSSGDDMRALAWRLASHETTVRGRQYLQVATIINDAVLRTPQTDAAFRAGLGFTYDQVLAVREGVMDLAGASIERAIDLVYEAAQAGGPPTPEAESAARALYETPSSLHLATAGQIADAAQVGPGVADGIMEAFSARPDGRGPEELLNAFCAGRNPLAGTAILCAPGRGYLPLPGAMAVDEIRRTCERPLKGTPGWTRYGRARDQAVERLAIDTVEAAVGGKAKVHRNLRYRFTEDGHDLSSTSTTHRSAPTTEADALLVLDGVALCVEVKAGDLRPRSRQGGSAHLEGDMAKTVKEAAQQADRLRSLIETHRGLWLDGGGWLDLDAVHEIHSIVVCLDDLGPLSLATAELVRAGVLTQDHLPWVVSVHDLVVFKQVLDRPEQFLTYLRRRTNRDAAMWITGSDELDILMWFVAGGFYFEADPDRLFAMHPNSKRPTAKQRKLYAEQGRTQVGTLTDTLDAFYYYDAELSSQPAPCPRRSPMDSRLSRIFNSMRDASAPGWWRASADIDGHSDQSQRGMAQSIEATMAASAADRAFHTFATGGFDDTGRWIYIFAAGPDSPHIRERLELYLSAKKHQDHADRALGVLLGHDGKPRLTIWLDDPWVEDPGLDELARRMRLVPPDRSPSVRPPTVKRTRKPRRRKRGR